MSHASRTALFISHATPEDNAFTIWLGAKLSAAGYDVWADVLRLRGGQDWQRRLEDALRNKARKVLVVGTPHGVAKQGVRNEIQIAHTVGRAIGDDAFIIPLRLAPFDAPFLIVHAQYIDFQNGWARGLAELLETLEETYKVPRAGDEMADLWREVHLIHAKELTPRPETLVSNWLAIERQPATIKLYDFKAGISIGHSQARIKDAPLPLVAYRRGFLSFAELPELQEHFGPALPLEVVGELSTDEFLSNGWRKQQIHRRDARNRFSDLARRGLEALFRLRSLAATEMADGRTAWWGPVSVVPEGKVAFRWGQELAGRRQIRGFSEKRKLHWHFGVSAAARVSPVPHVRFAGRLIFSEDGQTPLDDALRMHRLRRTFAKSWRNARWRDMLLAYLSWLAGGDGVLKVPLGSAEEMLLRLPPMTFVSPVGVIEGDALGDDDDPSDDDEADLIDPDDPAAGADADEDPDDEE